MPLFIRQGGEPTSEPPRYNRDHGERRDRWRVRGVRAFGALWTVLKCRHSFISSMTCQISASPTELVAGSKNAQREIVAGEGVGRSLVTDLEWNKLEAEFRAGGFLASSASWFRDHFRSAMADWFSLAERLNALGQRMYNECSDLLPGKPLIDPTSLALQMMPRCLNAFQAAIILAERGMGLEAQTHVRSLFETAFWMGYLGLNPVSAIPQLRRDTLTGEIGLFEASLKHLDGLDPETRAEVVRQLSEMRLEREKLPKPPSIEEIAAAANYGSSYFFYKDLSGAATHMSFKSIHGFLHHDQSGDVVGHQVGPDEENAGKAVWLGCRAMTLAIDALGRAPGCSDYDEELKMLNEEVDALEPYRSSVR